MIKDGSKEGGSLKGETGEFRGGGGGGRGRGRMAKKISSGEGIRAPAVAMVGSSLLNFKSPLRYPIFHSLSQFGS